jgi:hypothetical protein
MTKDGNTYSPPKYFADVTYATGAMFLGPI